MKPAFIIISTLMCYVSSSAQTETPDSIKSHNLGEVVVEARNQRLGAEVSTYTPSSKQKMHRRLLLIC